MKTLGKLLLTAMALFTLSVSGEAKKIKKITASDIVLFYAGGHNGSIYDQKYAADYVSYVDRDGKEHWLFDGYLLLQIWDTRNDQASNVTFTPGMKDEDGRFLPSANQADWMKLIDYHFEEGSCIDAIDKAVAEASKRLGKPETKRQIIISIPDPMPYKESMTKKHGTTYWGLLGDKVADFSDENDRIAACKWFVDQCLKKYKEHKYENVELAGFYWITEETLDKSPLLPAISDYVHSKGYPITWIPYFQAPGYTEWREKGFDMAWYQPNYFFYPVPESQIRTACEQAIANGMAMEMELDERAAVKPLWGTESLAYKLRAYMKTFKECGPWAKCQLAYYQDTNAVQYLKQTGDPRDLELYYDFCDFVAKRPYRTQKQN